MGLWAEDTRSDGQQAMTFSRRIDPFNSQRWRGISQFGGLYMDASGGYESRQVRINFSYAFGSNQIKAARQRKTGSEDEKGRL